MPSFAEPSGDAGDGPAPLASIVICTYGKRDYTERCLASLERALGSKLGDSFELVLVDNASPDSTLELFERWEGRAELIRLPQNLNFAGGNNVGARSARGEVLVFLNNDTEVSREALERVVAEAREPSVGIAGARLLYPEGRIQHGGVVFRGKPMALPLHLFHHDPGDLPLAAATYDLDATTGACLAIRRALFAELGGFEEAYVNGLEDVDLCIRVRLAGFRVVYRGDAAIIHHERATRGAGHSEQRNLSVFTRRWRDVCGDDGDALAHAFGARFIERQRIRAYAQPLAEGATVELSGELETICTEAAEGRALLALADAAEIMPALRDAAPHFTTLQPPFDARQQDALEIARARFARPDALSLHVPGGAFWSSAVRDGVVRTALVPERGLREGHLLLVPSQTLRERFLSTGVAPARVVVLRPSVQEIARGAGGGGVLVLVPGHDLALARSMLAELRTVRAPVTLLPNVRSSNLERIAAQSLSAVELLDPVTDEPGYAELAGRYDVVVTVGDSDGFDRRALIAAATGTAVVARHGGPAAEVLADGLELDPGNASSELARRISDALEVAAERAVRTARVAAECGIETLAPQLSALVAEQRKALALSIMDLESSYPCSSGAIVSPASLSSSQ